MRCFATLLPHLHSRSFSHYFLPSLYALFILDCAIVSSIKIVYSRLLAYTMDTISGFLPFQYRHYHKVDVGRLQVDAPDPPRYLIRVHSTYSQGCMTDDSFVSAAESWAQQNDLAPPNLQQYNSVEFERHVHNHLTNFKGNNTEPFRSPFISLTVSLRLALAWAKMRSLWGHRDIRIVVLDTSTIPASNCDCGTSCEDPFHQNPIWPADMIYKVCNGVTKDFPDEFLAFGHVRGVFKICTFAELETTFLNQYIPELSRLPRDQRYEELPMTLQDLWSTDQPLRPGDRDLVIHVAKQLSNDDLLIPMVAFVLCIRRRLVDDRDVLGTVVRAARLVEKQKTYDFLGYFDAFPIIDFFSKRSNKPILTADSVELVQTSAILERVKLCFAETQETEARKMWDCTTVALICRYFCPRRIREAVSRTSLQSRKSLSTDLARNFSRLQVAVFRSKFSGLRLLRDALLKAAREYGLNSVSTKHEL